MDVLTPDQRRLCMSRNRGKNTKPELRLRRALWREGCRYRLHTKLPGKPDMAFARAQVVVFVDGCFWHGCPEHGTKPQANASFWSAKLRRNAQRDQEVNDQLVAEGWTVIRVWEHELKQDVDKVVRRIQQHLTMCASLPKQTKGEVGQ